ncbi:MAG TPA: glycosyltransferase family 39 protein, partial [Anaerolineales bacterium]|nr:glycosyltransferase family 39 protein [Anaerolineales bacterium]
MPLRANPAVVLLPLALVVRLLGIGSRPIWYDEAFAILFASQGPARMAYGTLAPDALGSAADIHPLGYYTLLWTWIGVFGRSITAGRVLSVLIGCAAVWLAIRLLRGAAGERAAWWGGIFLALSPFHVHYSQEVRMYGLLALFLIGATFVLWRALGLLGAEPGGGHGRRRGEVWRGLRPPRPSDWILFSVLSAAAMYTHNLAAFYLAPLALIPFWL